VQIGERAKPEQNILRRGREMRDGEVILQTGARLRPQEFGLLSAVGRTHVKVHPAPRVAILPTGDEVVPPSEKPAAGQIRNSNGMMLLAQTHRAGGIPHLVGIARDNEESLRKLIAEGLRSDVLILSGGVSAGKKDLVPGVLQELGVQPHFHKVEMKPGKPVFFGTCEGRMVFGLPGNPVSSLVCFELFVRPALRRLQNRQPALPALLQAELAEGGEYHTDRPTWYPVRLEWKDGKYRAQMLPWFGSPDLRGVAPADAFAVIPKGEHRLEAGQIMDVLPVEYV
jgi:molybdopterin molybdotransferase